MLRFNKEESEIIILWYENVIKDFMHYGNGTVIFPDEAILINKLKEFNENNEYDYMDAEMINDWMMKNITNRYGSSKYLIGIELDIYNKIKNFLK